MTQTELLEKVDAIKDVLDRSALYRRNLAPSFFSMGALGVAGSLIAIGLNIHEASRIVVYWMGIAVLAAFVSLTVMVLQAKRDDEPFFRGPILRMAHAGVPPLLIGALAGVYALIFFPNSTLVSGQVVIGWLALYGLSLNSISIVLARNIRPLGWVFMASSMLTGFIFELEMARPLLQHVAMGVGFGGLHLIQGWREWRNNG